MFRRLRMAAWAVAVTLTLSGLALADRDDDRDRDRDHRDKKHDRDRKRYEKREHDRDRDRQRRDNYSYQNGQWRRGDGDHDRDDRGRNGYYGNYGTLNRTPRGLYGQGGSVARQQGYADGAHVAQQDMSSGKPYQPYPRGAYGGRDRGYHSGYGSKSLYQQEYAQAFQQGYESAWGGRRNRW